jgi:hypothetical protein
MSKTKASKKPASRGYEDATVESLVALQQHVGSRRPATGPSPYSCIYPVRFAGAARISNVYPNADATPTIVVKAGLPLSLRAL